MSVLFRKAGLFTIFILLAATTILSGAEKTAGTLTVHDSLTAPNQPATIEVTLTGKSLLKETGLGGEPIQLLVAGNVVATAMTGGDGRAVLSYTPKAKGTSHSPCASETRRELEWPKLVRTWPCGNIAVRSWRWKW